MLSPPLHLSHASCLAGCCIASLTSSWLLHHFSSRCHLLSSIAHASHCTVASHHAPLCAIASCASSPASCCAAYTHAAAFDLRASPPLIMPLPFIASLPLATTVGKHTKSLLKSRAVSPTCVSHIMNNLPGRKTVNASHLLTEGSKNVNASHLHTEGSKRISFTPHRSVNGSRLLTKGKNKLRTFPVNSNFPVRCTRVLTHGKNNESGTNY